MKAIKIINLGISGFPYLESAPVNKCIFLNKALVEAGINTLVINNAAILSNSNIENFPVNGVYQGINYHYTTKSQFRSSSSYKRRIISIFGRLNEFLFVFRYRFKVGIDAAILFTDGSFVRLIYYRFLSKLLKFKLIIVYHEFRSEFENRKSSYLTRLNDKFFDKYFIFFVDAILPISEFLISHIKNISDNKPILKIPPLFDFNLYNRSKEHNEPFFLYCGSIGYFDIAKFIIKSFNLIENDSNFKLYLIIGGRDSRLKELESFIDQSPKSNKIKLFSHINYDQLFSLYLNAKGLLIPLKPTIRDEARFPQKIAEYVASGNPIVTTNIGEIKYYFTDKQNALIALEYKEVLFADKLNFIIQNPNESQEIGLAGKKLGNEHFNYLSYTVKMKEFLNNLLS